MCKERRRRSNERSCQFTDNEELFRKVPRRLRKCYRHRRHVRKRTRSCVPCPRRLSQAWGVEAVRIADGRRGETRRLLRDRRVKLRRVGDFDFVGHCRRIPHGDGLTTGSGCNPNVLALRLGRKGRGMVCLPPFHRPSSIVHCLISRRVPFSGCTPERQAITRIPARACRHPSLCVF